MDTTRTLRDKARSAFDLTCRVNNSAHKHHPEATMGPPPPISASRVLQPSAIHKNSNLRRPFNDFSPLPYGHDKLHKKQKTTHNGSKVSYIGKGTPGNGPQSVSREVSLASILKRSRPYHESATESLRESARKERGEFVPRYKRRKVTIVNPLFEEYKECLDASHDTLQNEGRSALNSAFEDLSTSIKNLALSKEQQLGTIQNQLSSVLTPLNEITLADGKFVNVSVELQIFESLLATEEKFLAEKWTDWEKLQEDIASLAMQVFGEGAANLVPEDRYRRVPKEGYSSDSAKWMKELEEGLQGPMEEMRSAGEDAMKKMRIAEKESERKFNEQKARIIAMITTEDD